LRARKFQRIIFVLVLAWLLFIAVAPLFNITLAETQNVTLYPTDDAYVSSYYSGSNYGSDSKLIIKYDASDQRYAYLKFDLSSIPEEAVILNATLKLHISYTYQATGVTLSVYRVTGDWSESSIKYSNKPGNAGSASDQQTISGTGWIVFDVTEDVKAFVNGTYDNYGWVLKLPSSGSTKEVDIDSSECGNEGNYPRLEIEYIPPVTVTVTETVTETTTETVYVTTTTENVTITETHTVTQTQTTTVNTTITDYVTETQTTTVTQTDTIYTTETAYTTETSTVTQTITDVITETATTTLTETSTVWANETVTITTTITPTTTITETNSTVTQSIDYQALAESLMPIVLIVGVLGTLLGLLLQSTSFRRGD